MPPISHRGGLPPRFRTADLPLALRFGSHRATLRFLEPGDAQSLMEFSASHTPDTMQNRYGYLPARLSPARAAELAGVDQSRDAALGVFEDDGGNARLVTVGRYYLAADGRSAEVAFVVHEDRRRLGIATTVLRALTAIARERGLTHLTAQVQRDNAWMLAIFRKAGASLVEIPGAGADEITVRLGDARPHPVKRTSATRRSKSG